MSAHSDAVVEENTSATGTPDVEKIASAGHEEIIDYDADIVDFEEKKDLKRGLKQRHIQMIALAGTIGTGLFLGSGKAITRGGPLGAFLGYLFVGVLVSGIVMSIAEMSALVPLSGGVVRHAENFFDPALAFAEGWNQVYTNCLSLPAEITAAAVVIEFWVEVNNAVWITILAGLLLASNLFFVRIYGELEFTFAILKITLIVALIIFGIVIAAGGGPDRHVYGFEYWRDPGLFATDFLDMPNSLGMFLGFWTTFANAAFAYGSVESISVAAAETQCPRRNIPKAAKRIFWRVLIFYVASVFVVTLIVPSNDKNLLSSTGTAAQSPFVIAATRAGVRVFPHFINAVVLTSAWSSGNSGMLGSSRALYGLAREGHAPKIFLRVNRFGIPYVAVCSIGSFMCLGYMTLQDSASKVFGWLQDLVAVAILVHWLTIGITYLRFYYGCKAQGISRDELPWKGPLQPYAAWLATISFTIILLTGGYSVFIHGHWDAETFVSSYFNIPLVLVLYSGYKFTRKTKLVSLKDMPIQRFIDIARANPEPPERPVKGWRRLNILWS